ncbi:MAG: proline--tRNA ligase [Nitrospirae bacterium]|nr:proline--tRNA ligase [Nitrospirota bacterium]
MKYSKLLIPTLKETPSEAEAVSHILMLRGGYVRQLAAGLYVYMPLFLRVMKKINKIIRQEMDSIGAQEVSMPVLHPAEVWQKTGRWYDIKDEMFRLKDRTGRDMCLAMTHEEIMTWLASREIRSYRDLPQMWYQIQTKLRDEARPKSGILRTREFIMKDSYSFDADTDGLNKSYELHAEAYKRIYGRCGLKFYVVESDPGMMGGATAHEYMAPSAAGEDAAAICPACGYAANVELAESVSQSVELADTAFEDVFTPEKRTVEEVSAFLGLKAYNFIKTLVLVAKEGSVLALIRGDQELHEKKTERIIGDFRHARKDEIEGIVGVEAGFIGPVGHKIRIIADNTLKSGTYVSGANKKDYHVRGLKPGLHFAAGYYDLHMAHENDGCPLCGKPLTIEKVIEIGNIFKLGTKYSEALSAVYLDKDGVEKPIVMGSYGIGPARIAASAIEQNHDENGIIWPVSIAPFSVVILPLNVNDAASQQAAEDIYSSLAANSVEVLLDDRDERAGIKFKDADLIGIPLQVVIGSKGLKENVVEIKIRKSKESLKVAPERVLETVMDLIKN